MTTGTLRILGWLACLAVVGAIVAGLILVGSPAQARREKADLDRVSDLEALTHGVRQFYLDRKELPATLDLAYTRSNKMADDLLDPETRAPYDYRVIDKDHFELCADFQTDQSKATKPGYYSDEVLPFWKHQSGRQCFALEAKSP